MFVSPQNSCGENLMPKMMVLGVKDLGGTLGHRWEILMDWISAL